MDYLLDDDFNNVHFIKVGEVSRIAIVIENVSDESMNIFCKMENI